jgi:hypothetical protein
MLHTQFVGELMYEGGKLSSLFFPHPAWDAFGGDGACSSPHTNLALLVLGCVFSVPPTALSHVFELKAKGHVEVPGYV